VKFSIRQILASAVGAVLAALIASSFGVTGTIIGVAIGSVAATLGSALVSQSIERGHQAVKQVVVRVPEGSTAPLLRRLGGTRAAGSTSSEDAATPTEVVSTAGDETTKMDSGAASVDETQHLEISAVADAPSTERLDATTTAVPPGPGGRRFTWSALAGTAAVVFLVALVFVTVVELIADKPFASIFGSTGNGPSLNNLFNQGPPASPTTTTSTSTPTSTTTSTTSSSTTTSSSSTTSTTTPSTTGLSGTTTTTNLGATTTTAPGSGTTTTSRP
jgi:hypothetical protein